jgi:hypothetical protein
MRKLPPYLEFKLQQLAILGLTFLVAFGAIKFASFARFNPDISEEIPAVILLTCPLFGCFIVESRGWWTRPPFWMFTTALLVAHSLVFLNVLLRHHSFGRWVFVITFLLELGLLIVLRNWLLPRPTAHSKSELP